MLQNIPNQHRLDFSTRRDLKTLQCQSLTWRKVIVCVCVCESVSQSQAALSWPWSKSVVAQKTSPLIWVSAVGRCVRVCVWCADTSPELSRWDTQVWQLQPQWFVCENRLYPHLCVLIWICPLQCWRPVYIWMCVCVSVSWVPELFTWFVCI